MPTPRRMVIATLKQLGRQIVLDQVKIKMLESARAELDWQQYEAEERIHSAKLRVDREMRANGKLIGMDVAAIERTSWENEGEEWKG